MPASAEIPVPVFQTDFEHFEEIPLSLGDISWGNPGGEKEASGRMLAPAGWKVSSWNQAFVRERFAQGVPGRDGTGACLEILPMADGSTIGVLKFVSAVSPVKENQPYFLKGYYASTCERLSLEGEWFDSAQKSLGKFVIQLPDTQDEWLPFHKDLVSPAQAAGVALAIEKKWQSGRARFDDLSLREGRTADFLSEFETPDYSRQDLFPIVGWLGPGKWPQLKNEAYFHSDEVHLDYNQAGFNLGYTTRFGSRYFEHVVTPEEVAALNLEKLESDPAFWGFQGRDEPTQEQFPEVARVFHLLRARGSDRPYWINLLPTYGFPSYEEYEQYVSAFMREVPTKFVTYDHYTLQKQDGKFVHRRDWFANLEIFRRLSQENSVTWGILVQLGAWGNQPSPDENAFRWQVFNSLVYGAKALGWFCYLTEVEYGGMNWRDHAIDGDGYRTENYSKVRRLNARIAALGTTLLRLQSTGVFHSEPLPELTQGFGQSKLVKTIAGGTFVLGEFLDRDGTEFIMISNRAINDPAVAQLAWLVPPKGLQEVSQQNGSLVEVENFAPEQSTWTVPLAPGEGRLFRVGK